ncbi:MAG: PadR family transcriptional regulator [Candidatus Hodarchaeales archaeon]
MISRKDKLEDKKPGEIPDLSKPLPMVRIMILALITKHPGSSGYDLINHVRSLTSGAVVLKTGTIYTALRNLEKEGYISSYQDSTGRKKRTYKITADGKLELQKSRKMISLRIMRVLTPLMDLIKDF